MIASTTTLWKTRKLHLLLIVGCRCQAKFLDDAAVGVLEYSNSYYRSTLGLQLREHAFQSLMYEA